MSKPQNAVSKPQNAVSKPQAAKNETDSKNGNPIGEERRQGDRRQQEAPVATERRKVQRRRQIDPTTCERDYTNDEIEFMQALDAYKRRTGNNFPSSAEILDVIISIGYAKVDEQAQAQ